MSVVCIGAFTAFSKGNLLWPLRKPFDKLGEERRTLDSCVRTSKTLYQTLENQSDPDNYSEEHQLKVDDAMIAHEQYVRRRRVNMLLLILLKPIFLCPMCMTSTWGTAAFFLSGGHWWQYYVIAVVGSCGLTTVLYSLYMKYHEELY